MRSMRMLFAVVAVLALVGGWASAQPGSAATPALTGQDYEEIKALYARYNQGSDFRDAELFVSAFADDAVMIRPGGAKIEGMANLRAERAERYEGQTGDNGRRHMNASHVITAMGRGDLAGCAIRVSGGWATTAQDWNRFVAAWMQAHDRHAARRRAPAA